MSGQSCGGRSGYPAVPRDSGRPELVIPLVVAPPVLLMALVVVGVSSLGGDEGASGAGDRNEGALERRPRRRNEVARVRDDRLHLLVVWREADEPSDPHDADVVDGLDPRVRLPDDDVTREQGAHPQV